MLEELSQLLATGGDTATMLLCWFLMRFHQRLQVIETKLATMQPSL